MGRTESLTREPLPPKELEEFEKRLKRAEAYKRLTDYDIEGIGISVFAVFFLFTISAMAIHSTLLLALGFLVIGLILTVVCVRQVRGLSAHDYRTRLREREDLRKVYLEECAPEIPIQREKAKKDELWQTLN